MPDKMFERLDANKDGSLTPDELAKAGERFQGHAERGLKHADTNNDGAISKDEALARADKRFARIDTNGDGILTQEEMQAQHHRGHEGKPNEPTR